MITEAGRAALAKARTTHGLRYSPAYPMWRSAKGRARLEGVEFSITPRHVTIPETCPLLGIPLVKGLGKSHDNSPTLDRIEPSKGYIPPNVWVISYKANRAKSNLSIQELRTLFYNLGRFIL